MNPGSLSVCRLGGDADAPPCPPRLPPAVFTSAVGGEALTAVLVLSTVPVLIEAKNRLSGPDDDVRGWGVGGLGGDRGCRL